jgi:hypothetical protein
MTPDPERLALARKIAPEMGAAIRSSDAKKIKSLIAQGKRCAFTIGGRYRIFAYGAPPVQPMKLETLADGIATITGVDTAGTVDAAEITEVFGTYRGRMAVFGAPHEFRADNGTMILLGDVDVLAWERA